MAIPYTGNGLVASALGATFTKELGVTGNPANAVAADGSGFGGVDPSLAAAARYARSVYFSIVGASTPSWTVDIQGKLAEADAYTNWAYRQMVPGDTPGSVTDNQLSVADRKSTR